MFKSVFHTEKSTKMIEEKKKYSDLITSNISTLSKMLFNRDKIQHYMTHLLATI